jgi:hypothetical protein
MQFEGLRRGFLNDRPQRTPAGPELRLGSPFSTFEATRETKAAQQRNGRELSEHVGDTASCDPPQHPLSDDMEERQRYERDVGLLLLCWKIMPSFLSVSNKANVTDMQLW